MDQQTDPIDPRRGARKYSWRRLLIWIPYLAVTFVLLLNLLDPLSVCVGVIMIGATLIHHRHRRIGGAVSIAGIAIFWLCSTPLFSSWLGTLLERGHGPVPIADVTPADAIVVLGGGVGSPDGWHLHPELNRASDRLAHAVRLYKAKKAPRVVVTGVEADAMAQLLIEWGIPQTDILREDESTSTRENALFTKRVLDEHDLHSVHLVTSAFHMSRAIATFREVGIEATAQPTDFLGGGGFRFSLSSLIPGTDALNSTKFNMREHIARCYYWWQGWIQ